MSISDESESVDRNVTSDPSQKTDVNSPPGKPETIDLKAMSRAQLESFVQDQGEPRYRADQIRSWLYCHGVGSIDEMTTLSKALRARLQSTVHIESIRETNRQRSSDGTVKCLYEIPSGARIETVLIPDRKPDGSGHRLTVCVSSQVGCAMGCVFCATGTMGFSENLTVGQIFDQARLMNDIALELYDSPVTNIVFMGMGEPLLNYRNVREAIGLLTSEEGLGLPGRRITLSTVGLAGRIRQLTDDGLTCNLAISIHAPDDVKRSIIMPVNRGESTDLRSLRSAIEYYHASTGRSLTYQYCLFRGYNDSVEDARRLATLSTWAPSKVNLIMYNPVEGLEFERTTDSDLDSFIGTLVKLGVTVTVRRSRGADIDAACGQLAVRSKPHQAT